MAAISSLTTRRGRVLREGDATSASPSGFSTSFERPLVGPVRARTRRSVSPKKVHDWNVRVSNHRASHAFLALAPTRVPKLRRLLPRRGRRLPGVRLVGWTSVLKHEGWRHRSGRKQLLQGRRRSLSRRLQTPPRALRKGRVSVGAPVGHATRKRGRHGTPFRSIMRFPPSRAASDGPAWIRTRDQRIMSSLL
jgi:hypothetical protein